MVIFFHRRGTPVRGKHPYQVTSHPLSFYDPCLNIPCSLSHLFLRQTKAEEEIRKRYRSLDDSSSLSAMAPPLPPPFVPTLAPVLRLCDCDVMMLILRTIVVRAHMDSQVASAPGRGLSRRNLSLTFSNIVDRCFCPRRN